MPTSLATVDEDFEDLGKDSDYLEDLARILENLGGLDTLVQELIQNADDARAETMSFDIAGEALVVDNDARFSDCGEQSARSCPWKREGRRSCDLHAFRLLSGASKRGETGTTGAFGIGFTAVYQVTDLPELISAGQHIVLDETLDPKKRARRCRREDCPRDHGRGGTRFILPWARESGTDLRSALRVDPVTDQTAPELEAALEETVPRAMLFLRHLRRVEIYVDGQLRRTFKRRHDKGRVRISGGAEDREYAIFETEFDPAVNDLRQTHAGLVGGREARTAVAVAIHGLERGLLYAGLPTHDATGLPFHINADFFPADDRRSLRWNSPPHASWNTAAIGAAVQALADDVEQWRDAIGAERMWASLRATDAASEQAGEDRRGEALRTLWLELREPLATARIVRSLSGEWITPAEARLSPPGMPLLAEQVLSDLGVNLVDRTIAADVSALKAKIPVALLGFEETIATLKQIVPVDRICAPEELPDPLDDSEVRDALLRTLAVLAQRSPDASVDQVGALTLAPEMTGKVGPLQRLYRASESDYALFRRVDPALLFVNDERMPEIDPELETLAPPWDCAAAVGYMTEACQSEKAELSTDVLDDVTRWLARHDTVIRGNPALKQAVRALPIWPTTRGRQALDEGVALPSGRLDSLPLANTVDLAHIPHLRGFLGQTLGLKSLDLTTYCSEVLPRSFEGEVTSDERRAVIQALGRIKPDVIGNEGVLDALRPLELVECRDGTWRHVNEAYRSSPDLTELLGAGYPEAAFDSRKDSVTRDVLEWLGLRDQPRAADLLKRIEQITASPPNDQSRATAHRLLDYFAGRANEWDDTVMEALRARAWMTADEHPGWHQPPTLYQRANRNWFASQAKFHDAQNERPKTDFLRTLGLETVPPAGLVTRHLLWLAERNSAAPWTLYEHLDAHIPEADLELLEDQACILVNEDGDYARPCDVFQSRHPFGTRRHVLPAKLRGLTRLLDALDIASEPNALDAKGVLEEVAREPHLAGDDASVVHACWQMIQAALGSEDALDLGALGSLAVALDSAGVLTTPLSLLFNDAPSLADRLADRLGSRLIARQEDTWRALKEAGVRNLSDAVSPEILGATGESLGPALMLDRLRERAALLARVVEAFSPGHAAEVRSHARSMHVDASTELLVRYHLDDDDSDDVYRVRALYDREADTLHITVTDGQVAWTECAKELARALAPSLLPHVIAPSFRAVLEPDSAGDAEGELNDLDIPRLEDEQHVDWEQAGEDWSQQAEESEPDPDAFEPTLEEEVVGDHGNDRVELNAHADGEPGEPTEQTSPSDPFGNQPRGSESGIGDLDSFDGETSPRGSSATRAAATRAPRSPGSPLGTGYLGTFLVVSPSGSGSGIASEEELENMAIDRAGTNAVILHEQRCGREAIRKSHSWPGYDVESYLDDELDRIIEVKSIDGPWDAARARLSKEQFKSANEHGDLYWLYVVEHARTNPTVWRIQDPGRRVHGFAYIPDWKRLAEPDPHTASTPDRQQGQPRDT